MGKWGSIFLSGEEPGEFICKLGFLIVWGFSPNTSAPPCSEGSWFPSQRGPSGRGRPRKAAGDTQGKAEESRWDTTLPATHTTWTFLFAHFWGGKIPEQAHLRLQRRFSFAALSLWSRSSRLGLWAAPGSFLEPSSFHRRLQCGPSGTGLWW